MQPAEFSTETSMQSKDATPKTSRILLDVNSLKPVRVHPGSGAVGLESRKGRLDPRGAP